MEKLVLVIQIKDLVTAIYLNGHSIMKKNIAPPLFGVDVAETTKTASTVRGSASRNALCIPLFTTSATQNLSLQTHL